MRTFRSDNNAGLCPEAMQAIIDANDASHQQGYGDDIYTAAATRVIGDIFGDGSAAYFVATGTAANVLALAALSEPWQRIVCHRHSHYNDDESTAPERLTGCRSTPVDSDASKVTRADIERIIANSRGDVHQPAPGVVTISNATEFGTVYTPDEVGTLCEVAHAGGFRVHMDGARFANAVVALGCTPRELTRDAGLDALSLGGTKNGLALGEAVVFFPQGDGAAFRRATATFAFHCKASGHLLSKHRFVAAPFTATLRDGAWLKHAAHANAMARKLAAGLEAIGLEPAFPVQANSVFVRLPNDLDRALQAQGHGYYPFGDADWNLSRLMCSFDTTAAEIEQFLAHVRAAWPNVGGRLSPR